MVCDWGMSDKLGPLHFGKPQGEVFLGRDFNDSSKDYSEQTAVEIDGEVKVIVTANYDRARKIVVENLDKLKALAEALLEYETVDGADIDVIFDGRRLERKPPLSCSASRSRAQSAANKPPRRRPGRASSRRRARSRPGKGAGTARRACLPLPDRRRASTARPTRSPGRGSTSPPRR